jgi:hypothetical protein
MRIQFNGREYSSINAMPADVRKTYEAALRLMTRQHTPEDLSQAMRSGMRVNTRISIGGKVYDNIDDLPPHLRQRVAELAAKTTRPSLVGKLPDKKVTLGFVALLALTMLLYFSEYTALHNTFGSNMLAFWALLPAFAVAVVVLPRLFSRVPVDGILRWVFPVLTLLCVWGSSAALLSMVNRGLSSGSQTTERFIVERKLYHPPSMTTTESYNLLVKAGRREANFVVNRDLWQATTAGGTVEAQVRHGALGFDYVVPNTLRATSSPHVPTI